MSIIYVCMNKLAFKFADFIALILLQCIALVGEIEKNDDRKDA